MTPAEHQAQREMVVRSLLMAPTRTERGEERPRRPKPRPKRSAWVMPVVNERKL